MRYYEIINESTYQDRVVMSLTDFGLQFKQISNTSWLINRDSMVEAYPRLSENDAYDRVLKDLRDDTNLRLYWGIKDDDDYLLRLIINEAIDPDDWQGWEKERIDAIEAYSKDKTRASLERVWAAQKAQQDYNERHDHFKPEEPEDEGYAGQHSAPMHDSGAPLFDLTKEGIYPADFYTGRQQDYLQDGDENVIGIIFAAHNRPNMMLKIYRAIPKNIPRKINVGDWVAINRRYAVEHGRDNLRNDYVIVSKTVYARDVFTAGDSLQEWGYDPQPRVLSAREKRIMKT